MEDLIAYLRRDVVLVRLHDKGFLHAKCWLFYSDRPGQQLLFDRFKPILAANPLYPMIAALSDVVNRGETPSLGLLAWGAAWAFGAFTVGALFFISREREFAVRL